MRQLSQWLEHIESLHPSHIELGLDRVKAVAEKLDLLQFSSPVITVAGTNGKGSTIAVLEALLSEKGLSSAVYTSPHLLRFNERLRIKQSELSDECWCEAFAAIEKGKGDIGLTYFEFTTLAAFYLIKQHSCDYVLLEIGLGGRLDAVNIIDNQCSIITSIHYDHEDWLGHDLESIASEKAGVIRANTPVIAGDNQVKQLISPYTDTNSCYAADNIDEIIPDYSLTMELPFLGKLHPNSLRSAVLAADQFNLSFSEEELKRAFSNVDIKGRWQKVYDSPSVWLDVAHNPQAIENLIGKLSQHPEITEWVAICGMLKDKKALLALSVLQPHIKQWLLVPTTGPRGLSSAELKQKLPFCDEQNSQTFNSEKAAIDNAISHLPKNVGIIDFGSFLVVANMVEYFQQKTVG